MSKTNENTILLKLKYIGLDLDNIPNFLTNTQNFSYKPLKSIEENTYKTYRYIPISKIQILLTPCNRLNNIEEKYSKADSISLYLDSQSEENILKYTSFLKMLEEVDINDIKKIEKEQKKLQKNIPFLVKFNGNYLWQIYYSDIADTYFMLVPTHDLDYATFFYLLKKQIELKKTKKEEWIFVPISHEEYSGKYLKKSQIGDLEKYIWQFTKNWPITYEVYDKQDNLSIQIVGKIEIYEKIESEYKINLKTKEEAEKFYKLLKALFILVNDLPNFYNFNTRINMYGTLEFEYQKKKITYDELMNVLVKDYEKARQNIEQLQKQQEILQKELNDYKYQILIKEQEYVAKERMIATYLECKKTFFGKIKYFFKSKKLKKGKNIEKQTNTEEEQEKQEIKNVQEVKFIEKDYYTIEDIIHIYKNYDDILQIVKKLQLDIDANKRKIETLTKKLENATLYLSEIDKHEKSIFEFWKFANKDEQALLEAPKEEIIQNNKLEKVFNYKEDFEELAILIDKSQRKILTKEDTDAIFICTTNLIKVLNNYENKKTLEESLKDLKNEAESERILFNKEEFDLFGNVVGDNTKIQLLSGKKHRESRKNKLKILDVTKNLNLEEYKNKILEILKQIDELIPKFSSPVSIPVYCTKEELEENLEVFHIKPEEAILDENGSKQINLFKLNIKEEMPVVFFTNNIYYDNYNKTLPLGMDVSSKCLINLKNYKLTLVKKDNFRIVKIQEEVKVSTTKINIYEYDIRKEEK